MGILGKKGRLTAQVGRILSDEIVKDIRALFMQFPRIPYYELPTIYQLKYGKVLDLLDLGFDNGLAGFLEHLSYLLECKQTKHGYSFSLKKNQYITTPQVIVNGGTNIDALIRKHQINKLDNNKYIEFLMQRRLLKNQNLFNPDNTHLWTKKFENLLDFNEKIYLVPSEFDVAFSRSSHEMTRQILKIRQAFARYPNGVYLHELSNIVSIDKTIFLGGSTNAIVDKYPEIFYRFDPKDRPDSPIVFDGTLKTSDDLSGAQISMDPTVFKSGGPSLIAFKAIKSGVYQKTLLLIRKAGPGGLKLTAWKPSMEQNFAPQDDEKYEKDFISKSSKLIPLKIFLTFAHLGMIDIRSHESCKNDLRIHFPQRRIDFKEFMETLVSNIKSS